jgi:cell division protein FtsB
MDVFTMVAVIVVVSVGAGLVHDYLKTRRYESSGKGGEVRAELDALRERVRVLEEIVTDDRYRLNSEISRLERRDRPA